MSAPTTPLPPLVEPAPELTLAEKRRYARHLLLPEIGEEGQRRLKNARVLVIGAGGLGSPALMYLAAAGIGTIGVVDDDVVDESNLQRQVIHGTTDVGRLKVDSAREAVARINPLVTVVPHAMRLTPDNALDLIAGYDLVLDGADNFATRYLVGDACEILGTPYVWGSILRFDGQVSVFWRDHGPMYRDIFPEPPDPRLVPSCAEAGVMGVLCAAIGAAMGAEAIKLITGRGRTLVGRLLIHDALAATWREIAIRPDPSRERVTDLLAHARDYTAMCGLPDLPEEDVVADRIVEVPARELAERLAAREAARGEADLLVVDVREPAEHDIVAIEGAELVPLGSLLTGEVHLPRERDIVLFCKAGVRSERAARALLDAGYERVSHVPGGILAWIREVDPQAPTY
ncbi:molybdopterin-synthase adenylyltransferase MoeB [Mobilicoccus massiliensis]|uniref:molybdopterin-synthase adenylyltransferase MoeB n=1 Tax=Mobilicoccus massiliensis TaxID=1522310 RepID=UPI000590E2F2|nr:molybdopterin-synthase adenylyltransferase MoeB [Mobilicoccus massiliensis]